MALLPIVPPSKKLAIWSREVRKRPNFSWERNRTGKQGILIERTVLLNPKPDATIYKKEVFGPMSNKTFEIDEVVKMAKDDARNGSGGMADAADLDHPDEGTSSWKYFPI